MSRDDEIIQRLSALAQPTRLAVFKLLMRAAPDGLAAGVLSADLGVQPNTLSSHLNILLRSGLVSQTRQGRNLIYRAEIDMVSDLMDGLVKDCCQDHPEIAAPAPRPSLGCESA